MSYYTLRNYMSRLYDERGRQFPVDVSSHQAYSDWKEKMRRQLMDITGISIIASMPSVPLNPIMIDEVAFDGYTRQSWVIQTEQDVQMPFYLMMPDKPNGAAILNPHGHGGGRDTTVGNEDNPYVKERYATSPERKKTPFCVEAARAGYIVACPDARGSGERRESGQQGDDAAQCRANSHREINQMGIGFGICTLGMMVWDLMKLTDFLLTPPLVDPKRIGALGMSGGGQQTLYLTALDDRISAAVTSGYFYGFKEALLLQPANCSCNFIPHIWETLDMGDLGAMIAPRAFFVESGRLDHLSGAPGIDNVIPQVEIAKSAFDLFGKGENLTHSIHGEGHMYIGTGVLDFFAKWL